MTKEKQFSMLMNTKKTIVKENLTSTSRENDDGLWASYNISLLTSKSEISYQLEIGNFANHLSCLKNYFAPAFI